MEVLVIMLFNQVLVCTSNAYCTRSQNNIVLKRMFWVHTILTRKVLSIKKKTFKLLCTLIKIKLGLFSGGEADIFVKSPALRN